MRAYFDAVEEGLPIVRSAVIEAALEPHHLAALRASGLLRSTGRDPFEEVSLPDLARVLRALYDVESRALPVPTRFDSTPAPLGWIREGGEDRDVILFVGPAYTLPTSFRTRRRILVLLPTARRLSAALRAKYPPGGVMAIEVLSEVLTVRDGRIARAGTLASHAADLARHPPAPPPALAPSPARTPAPAPALAPIHGAARWNVIHVALVDPQTVHVEFPGVSVRRTHVDLGMAHARTREPTRPWELLVALCEGYGIFQSRRFGDADASKKLVSRLGVALRAAFGLKDTPFHPYRPREGWRTKFQAAPERRGRD